MAFFDNISFPFFTMQELNLDWILKELKRIAGFMPQDGNVGDILTRKSDGAEWEPPQAVNINIDALPQDTQIMDNDKLIFYDISAQANRKIKPPDLLDSMCSNGTPLMNGTGAAGTSKKPARYDHVHPVDTSRAPANYFQNGALKVEHGGTGADNASDARVNLGLGDAATENVVPLAKGGTGANNASDARTNLGLVTVTGSITVATGTNHASVKQYGNVVCLSGYFSGVDIADGNVIILGTIAGVSLPSDAVRTDCGIAVHSYDHPQDVGYFVINTDGTFGFKSTLTGSKNIYFNATYIV